MSKKSKFTTFLIFLMLTLAGLFVISLSFSHKEKSVSAFSSTDYKEPGLVYLVTGVDSAGYNSDVIMLVNISRSEKNVSILQIPRDTYVNIKGKTYHKINAIFSSAARKAQLKGMDYKGINAAGNTELKLFLEEIFSIKIDGYVSVNTAGLANIVDSFSGVDIDLEEDARFIDNKNDYMYLSKGKNHLNGDMAARFVRCRSYKSADYGRMNAQKIFVSAMMRKIKQNFTPTTIYKAVKSIENNVYTDIDSAKCISLAKSLLTFDKGSVTFDNLVGENVNVRGASCEVLSKAKNQEIAKNALKNAVNTHNFEFDRFSKLTDPNDSRIDKIYKSR